MTLTAHFPTTVGATAGTLAGTVDIVSAKVMCGVVTPTPDAFLVRDARIVTLPVPADSVGITVELGPGRVERLHSQVSLEPCDPDEHSRLLPPGAYELFVRVLMDVDDGTTVESVGGPWPLRVT